MKSRDAGDVAAERADGLRQRADLDVHAAVHAEVVDGAAAVPAEHAAGVRVVHHHDRAELLGHVAERRQRPEVAVHAEDAVGDEQLALAGRAGRARIARAASTSLCGNTLIAARDSRQPSMMLAWFSASETTTSSFVRMAETVPALAVKPLWKTTTASVCLNSASRRSSSTCMAIVPAIVRTEPVPTPKRSSASSARACSADAWSARDSCSTRD